MGAYASKEDITRAIDVVEAQRKESEQARKTIEQWQPFIQQQMRDAQSHNEEMMKKLRKSEEILAQSREQLKKANKILEDVTRQFHAAPKPSLPEPDLVNINGHLLDRNMMHSARIERYEKQLYSALWPSGRVIVTFKDHSKFVVADVDEHKAVRWVEKIHALLQEKFVANKSAHVVSSASVRVVPSAPPSAAASSAEAVVSSAPPGGCSSVSADAAQDGSMSCPGTCVQEEGQ